MRDIILSDLSKRQDLVEQKRVTWKGYEVKQVGSPRFGSVSVMYWEKTADEPYHPNMHRSNELDQNTMVQVSGYYLKPNEIGYMAAILDSSIVRFVPDGMKIVTVHQVFTYFMSQFPMGYQSIDGDMITIADLSIAHGIIQDASAVMVSKSKADWLLSEIKTIMSVPVS